LSLLEEREVEMSNRITLATLLTGILVLMIGACCGDNEVVNPENGCSTPPADPMPVPTSLANPDSSYFEASFTASWDHVWTGCGGYEFEYRRAATSTWITTNVASGSEVEITIPLPEGQVNDPTSYELRVRSYWGTGSDVKEYSEYSESSNIEMRVP